VIVIDTGVLYAAADSRDHDHDACVALLDARPSAELIVPAPVVTESALLIRSRLGDGTEQAFVASVAAGDFTIEDLTEVDYQRCAELLAAYEDLHLGLVDASVVAVSERLHISTIGTTNHRDFRVVRPRHVEAFTLLP
jgi:predicted nucleic acid-binding protein